MFRSLKSIVAASLLAIVPLFASPAASFAHGGGSKPVCKHHGECHHKGNDKNPINNTIHPIVNNQNPINNTIHPIVNNNPSGLILNGTVVHHLPVISLETSPNGPLYGGGHYPTKIVRDHRGPGGAQGPSSVGPNNVTGVGADPISEGISWLVNGVGSLFDNQVPDPLYHKPTAPVDHRH